MTRLLSTILAVLCLITTAMPAAADEHEPPKTPEAGEVVPGEVVVKWREADQGPRVTRARGLALVAELGVPGKGQPSVLSTAGRPVEDVLAELRADPAVAYADPNYVVKLVGGRR